MFRRYQPLSGRDWLARIPAEDRQVFAAIGRMYAAHGKTGGIARARTAARDSRGRFLTTKTSTATDVYEATDESPTDSNSHVDN